MSEVRILLVEDDETLGQLIGRNLRVRGYAVLEAGDARQALAHLRTGSIDLILLDINLPDQTGWDVLRAAKQEDLLPAQTIDGQEQVLPVVVLSAVRVSPARLAEFRPLAHLPKPFPMEALLRLASEAAQRKQQSPDSPPTHSQEE